MTQNVSLLEIEYFDFIIAPYELSFKDNRKGQFFLELCKGPQIWKQFNTPLVTPILSSTIKINEKARIKIPSKTNNQCQWIIYQKNSQDKRQFLITLSFELSKQFQKYKEKLAKQIQIYSNLLGVSQLSQKEQKEKQKNWQNLKQRLPFLCPSIQVKSQDGKICLKYSVQICSKLDKNRIQNINSIVYKHDSSSQQQNTKKIFFKSQIQQPNDFLPQNSIIAIDQQEQSKSESVIPSIVLSNAQDPPNNTQIQQIRLFAKPTHSSQILYSYQNYHSSQTNDNLSDIVQDSKQSQSVRNYGEGQNNPRLNQVQQIPQEENQIQSPLLPRTKTYFRSADRISFKRHKRTNTYDSNQPSKTERKEYQSVRNSSADQSQEIKQNRIGIQTAPQSSITSRKSEENAQQQVSSQGVKSKFQVLPLKITIGALFLILLIAIIGAQFSKKSKSTSAKAKPTKAKQIPLKKTKVSSESTKSRKK